MPAAGSGADWSFTCSSCHWPVYHPCVVEHQTMNTVVHAAVRRDLERLERALADFPSGSRSRAERVDNAWRFLDGQLSHHHHSEEEILWPALKAFGVDESLVTALDDEHEAMAAAMGYTWRRWRLAADPSAEHVADAQSAVTDLHATIDDHFAHEERDLEPVMAKVMSEPAMKKAEAEIGRGQKLSAAGAMLNWVLDDADPGTRAFVGRLAPKPFLFVLQRAFRAPYRRVALTRV